MVDGRAHGQVNDQVVVIQFARSPVVGGVKTRLAAHMGAVQACALHCELVEWTCRRLVAADIGPVELHVAGDSGHQLFTRCLEIGASNIRSQGGADLGERMHWALANGLQRFEKVLLVGSDCPGLDGGYLAEALAALDDVPVVLGPALDGGYVLIGATRIELSIFQEIEWGSGRVYRETLKRLESLAWASVSLPALADIDRPEDLPLWYRMRNAVPGAPADV